MEDIGRLVSRYYVIKTDGIFSKNPRFLNIHEQGLEFRNLNYAKAGKGAELCLFRDLTEVLLSDRNEKDLVIKTGKQSCTLACGDRTNLLTDLLLYKDLWDLANNSAATSKIPCFKGNRQVDLADPGSKVPVTMQLLRSALLVEHVQDSGKHQRSLIRYSDVESVILTSTGIMINTKMEYEKYVFPNELEVSIVDLLKEMPKKHVGLTLEFKSEQNYVEDKLVEPEEFPVTAKLRKFGGLERTVRFHVNNTTFMEEDVKDGRVVLRQILTSIVFVSIKRKEGGMGVLKIRLPHNVKYKCCLKTYELDYVLSNILHSLQTRDETDCSLPYIMLEPTDMSIKVYGLNGEVDSIFENSLKKEIEEASSGDILDPRVKDLMLDAAFNANFRSSGFDSKFLALLFALLVDLSQVLFGLEGDPAALRAYEEYVKVTGGKKKAHAYGSKEETEKLKADPGRFLGEVYLRIPPLLTVIRNLLFWRTALPDLPAFQKQVETLIALSGSKNSIVAINGALTLRSLMKLNKSGEKRLETSSKKWVVRELDVINRVADAIRANMDKNPQDFLGRFFAKELQSCPYLQLYGLASTFEVVLMEKREAHSEDLTYIVGATLEQDKVLNLVEQLSLCNCKPILYQASLVSAQSLLLLYNSGDKEQLAKCQQKILMYTTILLWNIRLLLNSTSVKQQKLSASVAALAATGNPECCSLIARLFPRSLLKKVDASKALVEWKPENWKELFVLLQSNYHTATDQWNDECRQELDLKLKQTALDYLSVKYAKKPAEKGEEKIRWNHEEYEVRYSCLEQRCKVGKYYLKDLLGRKDSSVPYLTEAVAKPVPFWTKLVHKFLGITNVEEQQLVLTVLNLIYRDHFQVIRDIKILPHFVHLLEDEGKRRLHSFVLELIYTTLKIKHPEVVNANYKMIIRANGLENLINLLSRTYTDNPEKLGKSEKVRRGGLIIRILDILLKKMDKKAVHPVSLIRAFCERREHTAAILQALLVDHPTLRRKAIKFIGNYFVSQRITLKDTGVVDFLMTCLDEKTGVEALTLLYRIQTVVEDYNKDLDMSQFSLADMELIKTRDKIANSIFLRYFPVPFVKFMTEETNVEQVLKTISSEKIEQPALVWSRDMRKLLGQILAEHLSPFNKQLVQFVSTKKAGFRCVANMPIYPTVFRGIIKYPQIAREIRCAEYYLRVWNLNKGKMENSQQAVFFGNLEKTFNEVTAGFPTLDLGDFTTVLRSFSLAYANFNKKGTFPCYKMLLTVIEKVCESVDDLTVQPQLKNMLKFVHRTMTIGMNFNAFEEAKGTARVMSVLIAWLRSAEEKKYAALRAVELSGIRWALAIINEAVERNPTLWNSIEYVSRELLLKKLFELVYYLQYTLFETEYKPIVKKEEQKVRHLLGGFLKTPKYRKVAGVNYESQPLLAIIAAAPDPYSLSSMFHTIEMVHCLLNNLSQSTDSQREILLSGCLVLSLMHFLVGDSRNIAALKPLFSLEYLESFSFMSFRHLAGFVLQIKTEIEEPLRSFGKVVQHMFCDHILRTMVTGLEVVAHRVKESSVKSCTDVLAQVLEKLDKNMEHPECLWNESTRSELKKAIRDQLEFCHQTPAPLDDKTFAGVLEKLEYTAYRNEIILGGVFIRLLNKDPYMHFTNPTHIMRELVRELGTVDIAKLSTDEALLVRTVALFEALNNIVVYQKGLELHVITQEGIRVMCSYLDPGTDVVPKHREAIYTNVLSILLELTKDTKQTLSIVTTNEFQRLALSTLIKLKNEYVTKRVMACMENIVAQTECDDSLLSSGLLLVFLGHVFNNKTDRRYRQLFFSFAQTVLVRIRLEGKADAVQSLVPRPLLERIVDDPSRKPEDWIDYIDAENREVTLVWNKGLREKVGEALEAEVGQVVAIMAKSGEPVIWVPPKESYIAGEINKGEIVVNDIVLSVYIKCPYVKFKKPFAKFLDGLFESVLLSVNMLAEYRNRLKMKKVTEATGAEGRSAEEEKKRNADKAEAEEVVDVYQQGVVSMLTSLMLGYEQIYRNVFNLNKLVTEKKGGCVAFCPELTTEIIALGLQSASSTEMIIVLLEIAILLCEQREVFGKDDLHYLMSATIQYLTNTVSSNDNMEKTAEMLAFCVVVKILDRLPATKGHEPILDAIVNNANLLDKLKIMHAFKQHVKIFSELLVWKVCQFPTYHKILTTKLKYELSQGEKLEKIVKGKYEKPDKVWRKSPSKLEECKIYESATVMEDFDWNHINEHMLPLVGRNVFTQEKFGAAFGYMLKSYGEAWKKRKGKLDEYRKADGLPAKK